MLTGLMGSRDGLNSERRYVRTVAQSIIRYAAGGTLGQALAICIWQSRALPMGVPDWHACG